MAKVPLNTSNVGEWLPTTYLCGGVAANNTSNVQHIQCWGVVATFDLSICLCESLNLAHGLTDGL